MSHPLYAPFALVSLVALSCLSACMNILPNGFHPGVQACSRLYSEANISQLADLALWLDAQDLATLFSNSDCTSGQLSGNGSVACWKDKSSNARNFTQSTSGREPELRLQSFQNLNGINFEAARLTTLISNTNLNGASGNTVLMALQIPAADQDRQILDTGVTGGTRRTIATDAVNLFLSGASLYFYHPASYRQNRVLTVIENGTDSSIQEAGYSTISSGSIGAAPGVSGSPTVIGGRYTQNSFFIDSPIAEIVVVNRVLVGSELTRAQNWLLCKYGLYD